MRKLRTLPIVLGTSLLVATSALGADRTSPATLQHALDVFTALDADGDEYLSRMETAAGDVLVSDHRTYDADLDEHLNEGEFVLYYRHLLRTAGRPVGKDLEREATRLRAGQRAREVERERAASKRVKALYNGKAIGHEDALEWSAALWAPFDGRHPVPHWRHEKAVQNVRDQLVDLRHTGALAPDEIDEVELWLALRERTREFHHAN